MLTLESVLCPLCHAVVDYDCNTFRGRTQTIVCRWCENSLLLSTADPSQHSRAEIDDGFSEGSFGAFQFVLHPFGTSVCPTCGMVYPTRVKCCPGLVEFAVKWFFGPSNRLGDHSCDRIIDYLSRNRSCVEMTFQKARIQWEVNEASEIPISQLKEIADRLGPWATRIFDNG